MDKRRLPKLVAVSALVLFVCVAWPTRPASQRVVPDRPSNPDYFMQHSRLLSSSAEPHEHPHQAKVSSSSLQLLDTSRTAKPPTIPPLSPLPPPPSPREADLSAVDQKLAALIQLSMISLKLEMAHLIAAQAAADDNNGDEGSSSSSSNVATTEDIETPPPQHQPATDGEEANCLDAESTLPEDALPPLASVQEGSPRRACAFATYVRDAVEAHDAALVMFSVRMHAQAACHRLILVSDAVSADDRQRLAQFATVVDVQPVPHGHDNRGYDLLRLWQLTAFEKIVFLPNTVIALRNLTLLAKQPEWTVFHGGPTDRRDAPVMILTPSEVTFGELRRMQEQTARTSTLLQFLTDFFSRDKSALERLRQHRDGFRFTRATRHFSPTSYVSRLPVGMVVHQRDFSAFVANGTVDIFRHRPFAIEFPKAQGARSNAGGGRAAAPSVRSATSVVRAAAYARAVCGWRHHRELRFDTNFLRFVYESLLARYIARARNVETFSFFESNTAPVKLVLGDTDVNVNRYRRPNHHVGAVPNIDDGSSAEYHAATATLRPTLRFNGTLNFSAIFPSDAELQALNAAQRAEVSELRSRFLVAMASDIEAWHLIDPGLVGIADIEILPNGELLVVCEIRLEVESTKVRPDVLRRALTTQTGSAWMGRVVAAYRQATHSTDARMEYLGVEWEQPDAVVQRLHR